MVIVDIDGTITRTDAGGVVASRYSVYLLYWYKSTNTDAQHASSSELGLSMGLGHSHEGVTEAMAAIESGMKPLSLNLCTTN